MNEQDTKKLEIPWDTPLDVAQSIANNILDKFENIDMVSFHKHKSDSQMYLVLDDQIAEELLNDIKEFLEEELKFYMFHFN